MAHQVLFKQTDYRKFAKDVHEKLRDVAVDATYRFLLKNLKIIKGSPSKPGQPPAYQTGALFRSVKKRKVARGMATKARGEIIITSKYAKIHEFGGKILPKKAKMLAIPINAQADGLLLTYGRTRNIPNLFVYKAKSGGLFLARSEDKELEVLFALKDSVYMPPRPFVRPARAKVKRLLGPLAKKARSKVKFGK